MSLENVSWIWDEGDEGQQRDRLAFALFVDAFGDEPRIEMTSDAISSPDSLDAQAVTLLQKYMGVKYTWGEESPTAGFDCSGLVQYIWKQLGVQIPSTACEQWKFGIPVSVEDLKPGDALFFRSGGLSESDQLLGVGLFIGDEKFIEAPGSGDVVKISTLVGRSDYVGARRFQQPHASDAL